MSGPDPGGGRALRLYRRIVSLLPGAPAGADLDEVVQVFADQYADVRSRRGRIGLSGLWLTTAYDLVRASAGALLGGRRSSRSEGNPWTLETKSEVGTMTQDVWKDLVLAVRGLSKDRVFSVAAVLILGLGIGANTTMFTLVSTLFMEPPPGVVEPDRLVRLNRTTDGSGFGAFAYPDYRDYRDDNDVFDGLLAYDPDGIALTIGMGDALMAGRGWLVSDNYFDVLGARPLVGRWFTEDEDRTPGTHAVVVISHGLWASAFGRAASAVGASITLNGRPFTVIGVAPEGFRGASPAETPPELWAPIHAQPILSPLSGDFALRRVPDNTWTWLWSMGRLKDGVTLETAQAHMDGLARGLEESYADWNEGWGVVLTANYRFHPPDGTSLATITRLLLGVVSLVLLIACANVAILLLARGSARARDMALRAALGASRVRLIRATLTESLVLAVVGGALGIGIAYWTAGAVAGLVPMSFAVTFRPDWRVVLFALAVASVTALLFGSLPAWQGASRDVHTVLKTSDRAPHGARLRNLLVVGQVGLSLMVVTAAGLFGRSLATARGIDLGFATRDRVLVSVSLSNHGYEEDEGRIFIRRSLEAIRAAPGVRAAATMRMVPFRGGWSTGFLPPGAPPVDESRISLSLNAVSPGYFETMGIPMIAGRGFTEQDAAGLGVHPAVVNRRMAELYWPDEDPIGREFGREEDREAWTVVGVAEDAHLYELGEDTAPHAYLPVLDRYASDVTFIADTGGDPGVAARVREALRGIDPTVAVTSTRTMEEVVDGVIGRYRVAATTVGIFGLLALVLASVGLYGVLSYAVARRNREIGIRVALGASAGRVSRSVLDDGLRLAGVGTALGMVGALAGTRVLVSFLYGVSPRDPVTLAVVPIVLLGVAVCASLLPAWRATRVQPVEVLKAE